jgi:hypothetical protein
MFGASIVMTPRLEQQNQNLPQRRKGRKELQNDLELPRDQECQEITARGAVADLAVQYLNMDFLCVLCAFAADVLLRSQLGRTRAKNALR